MSTFPERVQAALSHSGLKPETLGPAYRGAVSTVYRWLSGESTTPRSSSLAQFAMATRVREDWLRTGEGEMTRAADGDTKPSPTAPVHRRPPAAGLVPIFDHATVEAAASLDGMEVDDESVTGLLWMPRDVLRDLFGVDDPSRVRRITVTGSSMLPTLQPGQKLWIVLIDDDAAPISGAVYIVRGPYGLLVKRLIIGTQIAVDGVGRDHWVTLASDNLDKERYPDERFPLAVFRRDFSVLAHVPRAELAL